MQNLSKVSIIIRTLNEAKFIGPLLSSIARQTYKNVETILVDSGSFDGTVAIAEKFCDKILTINQEDFTFGFALNYGIKHSSGDLICIVSAHTRPLTDQWLEELVSGFHNPAMNGKIAMSYGKQLGNDGSNFAEGRDFIRLYGPVEKIQSKPNYFCNNGNAMIRKDLWSDHPFDEALTGLEDIEWSKYWMDQEYKIVYKPKAAIYHIHRENPDQIRRRYWREALAARSIGILPLHKVLLQIPVQFSLMVMDILSAFKTGTRHKWKETFAFRINKLDGTLKSLSHEKFSLRDYSAHYAPFDYKVVEFQRPGIVKAVLHPVEPTKPNEVLIKVHYVGICETDFEVLKGGLDYYKSGWAKYPIVPGHEFSGTIVRIGSKVHQFDLGDPVVGQCILSCGKCKMCLSGRETACKERKEVGVLNHHGAYAEYISLPFQFVHKIPESLDMITASSIEPLAVVLKGLRRAGLRPVAAGEKEDILITGAGPIGHLAARVGHYWGHRITVFDQNNQRLTFVDDIKVNKMNKVSDPMHFSMAIECTGHGEVGRMVIKNLPAAATILLLGLPYHIQSIDLEDLVSSDKKIIGSMGSNGDDFREAVKLAQEINMDQFNDSIYDFDSWKAAWEKHKTKSVLKVKLKVLAEDPN